MALSPLISDAAIALNPLVTAWDDSWRPTRLDLADGRSASGDPDALRTAIDRMDDPAASAARAALDAFAVRRFTIPSPAGTIECGGRTLVMGILNTTPDSFSDGGRYLNKDAAVARGLELVEQGAHLLDIGGESTRPGAAAVPADEELRRTQPVVAELAKRCNVPISIDASKAAVAAAALDSGAAIVNDVTALRDPDMAGVVAQAGAALILMHMLGEPRTMQKNPVYADVLGDIVLALRRAMSHAAAAGIGLDRILVDPGIGFGKTLAHNGEILRRLPVLASLGRPILIGTSRKSMIQRALGLEIAGRLNASLALNVLSIAGRASIIRVHDVREAAEAAAMTDAVLFGARVPAGKT